MLAVFGSINGIRAITCKFGDISVRQGNMDVISLRTYNVSFNFCFILANILYNLFSAVISATRKDDISKQLFPFFDGAHRFKFQARSLPSCVHDAMGK